MLRLCSLPRGAILRALVLFFLVFVGSLWWMFVVLAHHVVWLAVVAWLGAPSDVVVRFLVAISYSG
jgi:hypothetical protein